MFRFANTIRTVALLLMGLTIGLFLGAVLGGIAGIILLPKGDGSLGDGFALFDFVDRGAVIGVFVGVVTGALIASRLARQTRLPLQPPANTDIPGSWPPPPKPPSP